MLRKPRECTGCVLETKGKGYAPASGPLNAQYLLVGESLGDQEVAKGEPFVGPAGEMLNRVLRRVGWDRSTLRIDNLVHCQPPNNWLDNAPWEYSAVEKCSQYISESISAKPRVIIALGAVPTRRLLGLPRQKHKQVDWHGCPTMGLDGITVVPTFHPSFLLREPRLVGAVCYDFMVAQKVVNAGWLGEPADLVVDPDIATFAAWVEEYLAHDTSWLAVDIETVQKLTGKDEGELEDEEDEIIRINFAFNPDQGITVPWTGQYIGLSKRLLASPGVKCFWNARYDTPRLIAAGCTLGGQVLDFMWAWHVLQSDLPRGLGFVAPFYSRFGAWKHLSGTDPGLYAAIDAVQTLRCAFGITRELQKQDQWGVFYNHIYELDEKVLHPAEKVGLRVDLERLERFRGELYLKLSIEEKKITSKVPESILDEKIWKSAPDDPLAVECMRVDTIQRCVSCGAIEVSKSHVCQSKISKEKRTLVPKLELADVEVPRWVKVLPFNPRSPEQIRAYMDFKGDKTKISKKSKSQKMSTAKKDLERLARKDPFYGDILNHRKIGKVLGTYVEGTRRRLCRWRKHPHEGECDFSLSDLRLHAKFLHKPSTLRLSCVDPNLQNVTTDREGSESIAAGFRACLIAS